MKKRLVFFFLSLIIIFPVLIFYFFYRSKASAIKANIVIDVLNSQGKFPDRFKALAQGGEEKGVRMLKNVIPQVAELYPKYIRIDHIYDFYDVVSKDNQGNLILDWSKLDETVCDIYNTGAKPFFVLGYMPNALSGDDSLISSPRSWQEWSFLVQKTIEHYSGTNNRLCGQITGYWKTDLYYEVWNEPDLETFGKWSIYGGKDYRLLYYYSVLGAQKAKDVYPFKIGGPVTTALYRNWILNFLDFIQKNNLRIDFISWHHYSKNTDDFGDDLINLNNWLAGEKYKAFQNLPKIISEWGFDSNYNPIADTEIGAAYTIASIRNFLNYRYELAFLFEIKDGPSPSWGILGYQGEKKPRYQALQFLNHLEGEKLFVSGEGSFVKALASKKENLFRILLVNYDRENKNTEIVPLTLKNLINGYYDLTLKYLDGKEIITKNIKIEDSLFKKEILMPANSIVLIKLAKTF
ncbi:MAG: GH39 family glycosyl hydrolase [Microgenomates group bacterium]